MAETRAKKTAAAKPAAKKAAAAKKTAAKAAAAKPVKEISSLGYFARIYSRF